MTDHGSEAADEEDDEQDQRGYHEERDDLTAGESDITEHDLTVPVYAVAYLRVSTQEQVIHGTGLKTQRDAISKWAKQHGRTIIGWHVDEGKSGGLRISQRRSLVNAVDQAGHEEAELVVYRLDRLARDLLVQEQCLADLSRRGSSLRSCDATEDRMLADPKSVDDTDAHTRVLMRQIIGAIGQWERAMIAMRMTAGRKRAGRDGWQMGGYVPYGWRRTERVGGARVRWEPDPGYRWHVAGWIVAARHAGGTWTEMAAVLTSAGIQPPSETPVPWSLNAVKRVYQGVERMASRGYATPGPPIPGAVAPSWGLEGGGGDAAPLTLSIGMPAAL